MIVKERRTVYMDDLVDDLMDGMVGLQDYQVIAVYDTAGNQVSKADELEIVIEYEVEDGVDKSELTPDEQNDELRRLGF
jgi:hypothetical protein